MNVQATPTADTQINERRCCKNCGTLLTNAYCGRCGQPAKTARLTFKGVYREFILQFIGADRGFVHTVRQLTFRPGHTVREYVRGKRQPYIKPFQYFLIFVTLNFLLMELLDVNLAASYFPEGAKIANPEDAKLITFYSTYLANLKLATFLYIPLYALVLLAVYRRAGYNFVELMVLNLYFNGQNNFYLLILIPLAKINFIIYGAATAIVILGLQIWMYAEFFGGAIWKAIGKATLAAVAIMLSTAVLGLLGFLLLHFFVSR